MVKSRVTCSFLMLLWRPSVLELLHLITRQQHHLLLHLGPGCLPRVQKVPSIWVRKPETKGAICWARHFRVKAVPTLGLLSPPLMLLFASATSWEHGSNMIKINAKLTSWTHLHYFTPITAVDHSISKWDWSLGLAIQMRRNFVAPIVQSACMFQIVHSDPCWISN